jgi:hypothetical protein
MTLFDVERMVVFFNFSTLTSSLSLMKIPHFFFYNCQQRVFVLRVECTFFNGVDKEEESFVIVVVVVVRFLILLL